jgi:hypothetical protein
VQADDDSHAVDQGHKRKELVEPNLEHVLASESSQLDWSQEDVPQLPGFLIFLANAKSRNARCDP